jgi:exoribonuclease R
MSSGIMSLESNGDKYALSLGVQLNPDGSIDPSSIIFTSSLIHVDYQLTYDQVDEMLDEGVGYTEEWQIGALLSAATKRRAHRVGKGSTEGMVPFPIPKGIVSAAYNEEMGEYEVSLKIETTHNSGANMTAAGEAKEGMMHDDDDVHYDPYCSPVSSSQLIVTEMMILGESGLTYFVVCT